MTPEMQELRRALKENAKALRLDKETRKYQEAALRNLVRAGYQKKVVRSVLWELGLAFALAVDDPGRFGALQERLDPETKEFCRLVSAAYVAGRNFLVGSS